MSVLLFPGVLRDRFNRFCEEAMCDGIAIDHEWFPDRREGVALLFSDEECTECVGYVSMDAEGYYVALSPSYRDRVERLLQPLTP